jgi:hypothetical protein
MQWLLYKLLNPLQEEKAEREMITLHQSPINEVYETSHIFDMVIFLIRKLDAVIKVKWESRIC